jgi:cytochrome c-type biogenesis protein CcmH/NrfF
MMSFFEKYSGASGRMSAVFAVPALLFALATPAFAQQAEPKPREPGAASAISQQISQEIYSPFCPGKTLAMCPSSQASEVRQEIQQMARDGMAKQAIIDAVISDIGEEYRIVEPPPEDNYMLLGLLVAALALCLAAIYFFGRRGRGKGGDEPEDELSAQDELSEQERLYLEELRAEYLE